MTTAYPIRPISADEFPAFYAVIENAASWPVRVAWLACETGAGGCMSGLKVTVDAAMRARDVSRPPPAEPEALADAGQPQPGQALEQGRAALPGSAGSAPAPAAGARGAAPGAASKARSGRRRRRRH